MTRDGWTQQPLPGTFIAQWEAMMGDYAEVVRPPRAWRHRDGRFALVGREFIGGDPQIGDLRWHISVRQELEERVLAWNELVATAHELRPGVPFCIGIPVPSDWMNVHPDVLHLWEVTDPLMLAEFKANAMGQVPT